MMMYYKASSVAAIYSSNSCGGGAPYIIWRKLKFLIIKLITYF